MPRPLLSKDFAKDAVTLARAMVGCTLLVEGAGRRIGETEAYDMSDAASHSHGATTFATGPCSARRATLSSTATTTCTGA